MFWWMNNDIYAYQRQKRLENTSKQSWDRDLVPDSLPPQKIHSTHCLKQMQESEAHNTKIMDTKYKASNLVPQTSSKIFAGLRFGSDET